MDFVGSYADFFNALRVRESSNDYSVTNGFGFLGAYQFGEAALVDLGFVTNDGKPFDNVFNGTFTGKFGVNDVTDFLSSRMRRIWPQRNGLTCCGGGSAFSI